MTSLQDRTSTTSSGATGEPMSSRLKRSGPLFVGAALVYVLLTPVGSLPLKGWVPVLIGLSFVAAGLLGGRGGRLLAPGVVLAAWGVAPMTTNYTKEFPGMFYLCLGSGLLIAAVLAQRGFSRITPMSLAIPVLFIGGTMFVFSLVGPWLTTVLAVLLVAWGLVELRPQRTDDRVPASA